jgi:hypothetical protein
MDLIDHLARMFNVQPGRIVPQQHVTSKPMQVLWPVQVKLLVGPLHLPTTYTQMGKPSKRQPKPMKIGDIAYAKLYPDGLINLYPFSMAGAGYELVTDAREGVHYSFI